MFYSHFARTTPLHRPRHRCPVSSRMACTLTLPASSLSAATVTRAYHNATERLAIFAGCNLIPLEEVAMTDMDLGKGAEGSVSVGIYAGRSVAVKKSTRFECIASEYRTIASLNHDNIVHTYGLVLINVNTVGLLLEHCCTGNLYDLANNCPFVIRTPAVFDRILLGILEGIKHIHDSGLIHMDIKAHNVLLDGAYNAKICDFGFTSDTNAESFAVRGTPRNISPEMARAWVAEPKLKRTSGLTTAMDIYSFGMMLLYCCNQHKHPYKQGLKYRNWWNDLKDGRFAVTAGYFEVKQSVKDCIYYISPKYLLIVERCMAYDPKERPTAGEVIAMLQP